MILKTNRLLLVLALLLFNCGEDSKKDDSKSEQTSIKATTVKQAIHTVGKAENLMETTPVSQEALEDWFPENLASMEKKSLKKAPMATNGISGAVAEYIGEGTTKMTLTLYDCAGQNGVLLLGQYALYKNMKVDNENQYKIQKSFSKDGMNGVENFDKNHNYSDISFLFKDRFGVNVKAYGMERETVWKALETLNFEALVK